MKKLFYLFPLALMGLTACSSNSTQEAKQDDQEVSATKTETEGDLEHEGHGGSVALDNGKKWQANPETTQGVEKMSTIVAEGLSAAKEPASLQEPLKMEFQTIFDKCTMTGEAHEQLHNFLIPIKGYLDKLATPDANETTLRDMQAYLGTYKNYFE